MMLENLIYRQYAKVSFKSEKMAQEIETYFSKPQTLFYNSHVVKNHAADEMESLKLIPKRIR